MDCDGELSLDMQELTPCYEYTFSHVFEIHLNKHQQSQLFYIMDVDGDSDLGFAEFVMSVTIRVQSPTLCPRMDLLTPNIVYLLTIYWQVYFGG